MRIVIAGGTGQVGGILARAFRAKGHEVTVLSRGGEGGPGLVEWDGRNFGAWAESINGCGAVINLAGRSRRA